MAKILVVDDDSSIAKVVSDWLLADKHLVEVVHTGHEAQSRLRCYEYDLLILDWQLPDLDGITICRQFRHDGGKAPVLMLTGKNLMDEKEIGFTAGADDYLTKPFNIRELSMRVQALLRRPATFAGQVLKQRDIELNSAARTVSKNGRPIKLVPREFSLLEFFMRYPDTFFKAEALIERLWPAESDASLDALRQCVSRLRSKIDDKEKPSIISTVAGMGYKFDSR